MPPQRRNRANTDLPKNLYSTGNGYFAYEHPVTGKRHGMGKDRQAAIEAAIELNDHFSGGSALVDRIVSQNTRLTDFIPKYKGILTHERKQSPKTLKETEYRLNNIDTQLGSYYLSQIDVLRCAAFLDQFPPRQSNAYRALLTDLYKWAGAKGLTVDNPATRTIPKKSQVIRKRWDMDGFKAAREEAPAYIQNAMNLALHTLLRREDLVKLKFRDYKDGHLRVATRKTGAHIDIVAGPELDAVIKSCRNDAFSHWMVHYPLKFRKGYEGKALTPEALTRGVQKARDDSGYYKDMGAGERPTLHEIRSLGAKLYEEQGINPQALLGHKDAAMTRVYLDRYEVEWIEATAGLKV